MTHEHKLGKRIWGGVLIALGVGIYVLYFWLIAFLRKIAAAEHFDPAFVNAVTAAGVGAIFLANWPSVLLLGFGIAWWWNVNPMVRVWCYRILMAFFLGGAGLLLVFLFTASLRNATLSSRGKVGSVAFWYLVAGLLFYWRSRKVLARAKNAQRESEGPIVEKQPVIPRVTARSRRQASFAVCNVLQDGAEMSQVWQFDARKHGFHLNHEHAGGVGEPLPASLVGKSWGALFQPKLNVAWLPPENVFLRVAHFPQSNLEETRTMVELQLERLSPIPVTQAVWSVHVLPQSAGNMQTVVVVIVARSVVEEFLSRLEKQGFMADRLELSMLDQLLATPVGEDGAWIYPGAQGGKDTALVAWWYGGVLQSVGLLTSAADANRAASLNDQLIHVAWAGELEGWLTAPPRWHLVADTALASEWEPPLRQGLGQPVEIIPPLPAPEVAALTAKRAARADPSANLLPAEFLKHYRQQFADRLWMRGLGAVLALYVVSLFVYFVAVGVLNIQTRKVEGRVAERSPAYTEAIRLKARYQVLKDRQELKYAALDCWKAAAELMPAGLTLDSMNFSDGRKITLTGTAPAAQLDSVIDFSGKIRKAKVRDEQMFDLNKADQLQTHVGAGGATVTWSLGLELKRGEQR